MQRKTWYSILGLDAMPLSLKNLLLSLMKTKTEPKPKNLKTGVQLHDPHLKVCPWTTARALLRSNAVKTEKDTEFTPNPAQA